MAKNRNKRRDARILAGFQKGKSYDELAKPLRLSRERIRQIVARETLRRGRAPGTPIAKPPASVNEPAPSPTPRQWQDVLPEWLAASQTAWERNHALLRASRNGQKTKDLAAFLKTSGSNISTRLTKAKRAPVSPLELYLAEPALDLSTELAQLTGKIQKTVRSPPEIRRAVMVPDRLHVEDWSSLWHSAYRATIDMTPSAAVVAAAEAQAAEIAQLQKLVEVQTHDYQTSLQSIEAHRKELATAHRRLAKAEDDSTRWQEDYAKADRECDQHEETIKRLKRELSELHRDSGPTVVERMRKHEEAMLTRRRNLIATLKYFAALMQQGGIWSPLCQQAYDSFMDPSGLTAGRIHYRLPPNGGSR